MAGELPLISGHRLPRAALAVLVLVAVFAGLLVGCVLVILLRGRLGGPADDGFSAARAGLSTRDLPSGWTVVPPEEFPFSPHSPVVELLATESTTNGAFITFHDTSGLRGATSLVALSEDGWPSLVPEMDTERLHELVPLIAEQERLARLALGPADAPVHFAATDIPREGSVRARSVLLAPSGGFVFSDSIVFSEGPVLAVVTVQVLEDDEPFSTVEDLAETVHERILSELSRLPSASGG
jgi:hypothetical protein